MLMNAKWKNNDVVKLELQGCTSEFRFSSCHHFSAQGTDKNTANFYQLRGFSSQSHRGYKPLTPTVLVHCEEIYCTKLAVVNMM